MIDLFLECVNKDIELRLEVDGLKLNISNYSLEEKDRKVLEEVSKGYSNLVDKLRKNDMREDKINLERTNMPSVWINHFSPNRIHSIQNFVSTLDVSKVTEATLDTSKVTEATLMYWSEQFSDSYACSYLLSKLPEEELSPEEFKDITESAYMITRDLNSMLDFAGFMSSNLGNIDLKNINMIDKIGNNLNIIGKDLKLPTEYINYKENDNMNLSDYRERVSTNIDKIENIKNKGVNSIYILPNQIQLNNAINSICEDIENMVQIAKNNL